MSNIPHVIHYCRFGGIPLDEKELACIASWKKYLPGYEIQRWDETNWDVRCCDYVSEAYDAKKWAFVSDYARVDILYKYGGLYFGTTVELIRPIDDILAKGPFMGLEADFGPAGESTAAAGLVLAANPGLGLYHDVLKSYEGEHFFKPDGSYDQATTVARATGMLLDMGLKRALDIQHVAGVAIYPAEYLTSMKFNTDKIGLTDSTRSIRYFSTRGNDEKVKFGHAAGKLLGNHEIQEGTADCLTDDCPVFECEKSGEDGRKEDKGLEDVASSADDQDILVSIICTAYNHEHYIGDALASFVSQECSFRYEVIVSDDASTDGTAGIIREFERAYPDIIKPVYHAVNQYSQGRPITAPLIESARGKYIALCEGDDFWLESTKLEQEVSYLESHPGCSFCFTNAKLLDAQSREFFERSMLPGGDFDRETLVGDCDLSTVQMMQISFIPTASFVFRKVHYMARPKFTPGAFMGDRYLQMVMTEFGYAHYFDSDMVAYRVNNPNSMMGQWACNKEKAIKAAKGYALLYREFDKYTGGRYASVIGPIITAREYSWHVLEQDYELIKTNKYRQHAKQLGLKSWLGYLVRVHMPSLARVLDNKKFKQGV